MEDDEDAEEANDRVDDFIQPNTSKSIDFQTNTNINFNLSPTASDGGNFFSEDLGYLKRDPEEEFFMLAVLAQKMIHTETYEDSEYVYEVSAQKLFNKVRDTNLPFHKWFKWLEDKFQELRIAFIEEQEQK